MLLKDDAIEWLDPTSRWEQEIKAIYDLVSSGPRVVFQEAGFMPIEPSMVLRIEKPPGGGDVLQKKKLETQRQMHLPESGVDRKSPAQTSETFQARYLHYTPNWDRLEGGSSMTWLRSDAKTDGGDDGRPRRGPSFRLFPDS